MQSEDDSRRNKLTACKPTNDVNYFVNQFTLVLNQAPGLD
jgi:hypothetical protein